MKRINNLINHPVYIECLEKVVIAERDRKFCKHDMNHFLDVARLATILNFQEKIGLEVELIYAAAMVHDIGKYVEYECGTSHEIASSHIARNLLKDCSFDVIEMEQILKAVENHRNKDVSEERNLSGIIYRGDKMSRCCFACKEMENCNWELEKKNLNIIY